MIRVSIRLMAPLSHGTFDASDIGNASAIRREPIVGLDGCPRVPVVSGNALRGRIRRVVMRDLLGRGKARERLTGARWDRLYAALANGGHLDRSEPSISPERIRALRESLPALSVLGSALYSWMLPGRCSVGLCWPVCAETISAGLTVAPDGLPVLAAEDLVTEISHTRHIDRDEHDPAVSGVTPMPVTVEALCTGAVLQSDVLFEPAATSVEQSVIAYGLDRLASLGGKAGAGLGRVEVTHDGDASPYEGWLGMVEDLDDRLCDLADTLGVAKKKKQR